MVTGNRYVRLILVLCLAGLLVTTNWSRVESTPYALHDYSHMVEHFRTTYGVDGSGITLAIIDTGIDPGVVALRGVDRARIIEWVDFTGEGRVETLNVAQVNGNFLVLGDGRQVRLGTRRSRSESYRYGWLRESSLAQGTAFGGDFNGNGRANDVYLVVLVDALQPGVYDTVYVDTRRTQSLADEQPIFAYSSLREHITFPSGGVRPGMSLVAASIDPHGRSVQLGFDGHGHGTQVASIAAASPTRTVSGVAPGVRLMSLKALTSDGFGSWAHLRQAMRYAAENRADIVLVSATGVAGGATGDEGQFMDQLSREFGTLFVLVAGNDGPGLGTISPNLAAEYALIVGAYATPALMQEFYQLSLPRTIVMPYSGVGPVGDLLPGPSLVAPGVTRALLPHWQGVTDEVIDGTSVAAPQVAGGVALLLEALHRQRLGATVRDLRRSLQYGALPISGYDPLEQGFGVPDLERSYQLLLEGSISPHQLGVAAHGWRGGHLSVGTERPAAVVLELAGHGPSPWRTSLETAYEVVPSRLFLTADGRRSVRVDTVEPLVPGGLATERVDFRDEAGAVVDSAFIAHVHPHQGGGIASQGRLDAGCSDRQFIQVEEGTTLMGVRAAFPVDDQGRQGIGEVFIYDPAGHLAARSGALGRGQEREEEYLMLTMPVPGVYQLVTVMDALTSQETSQASFSWSVEWEGYAVQAVASDQAGAYALRLTRVGPRTTAQLRPVDELGQPPLRLTVREGSTVFRSLSTVPADLEQLLVRISNPTVLGADLNLYLYHYDRALVRWQEVAASATAGTAEEWIKVDQPLPGNYLVYIEAVDLRGAPETAFRFEEHLHRVPGMVVVPDELTLTHRQEATITVDYADAQLPRNPRLRVSEGAGIFATLITLPQDPGARWLVSLHQGVRLDGGRSQALLTVVCAREHTPVEVGAVINGRYYPVEAGRAVLDILPGEPGLTISLRGPRGEVMAELSYAVSAEVSMSRDYLEDGAAYRRLMTHLDAR